MFCGNEEDNGGEFNFRPMSKKLPIFGEYTIGKLDC